MKTTNLFKQYVWLVDTVRQTQPVTLAVLSERWRHTALAKGNPLNRSTFTRHRAAIAEIFGIVIDCDAHNRYYIVGDPEAPADSVRQWMLGTLAVSNIVGEARGLHHRILLESIPVEGELLQHLVEAMRRSVRVDLTYRRYGSSDASHWTLDPYCIKLFRRRWYLLCRNSKGLMVLSLDRILTLTLTDEIFVLDPDFDAQGYFAEYFGVMCDSRVPLTRILLRAYGNERYALRDLPLHPSQQQVAVADDHVDYELLLRPTSDFLAHILSRGRWVQILSPADLAQQIRDLHQEAERTSSVE